jgi:hypothetical protein
MSKVLLTGREPAAKCEFCGEQKELRPYGPNGERICFRCMKKDEPAAMKQFHKRFFTDAVNAEDLTKPGGGGVGWRLPREK